MPILEGSGGVAGPFSGPFFWGGVPPRDGVEKGYQGVALGELWGSSGDPFLQFMGWHQGKKIVIFNLNRFGAIFVPLSLLGQMIKK